MDVPQETSAPATHEPILMGIYGIGGSGVELLKPHLQSLLRQRGYSDFQCFDLRYDLDDIERNIEQNIGQPEVPRSEDELDNLRKREIEKIRERCRNSGKIGLIFSHRRLLRSDLNNPDGQPLIRSARWGVDASFSYALYYSAPPARVVNTLLDDPTYQKIPRKKLTQKLFRAWDSKESESLVEFCNTQRVPMSTCEADQANLAERLVSTILLNSQTNQQRVLSEVIKVLNFESAPSNAVVLIEAHNILAPDAVSTKLWAEAMTIIASFGASTSAAVQRDMYMVLRQQAARYGNRVHTQQAMDTIMDPELERLLWKLTHVGIPTVVLTCGLKSTWEEVLGRPAAQDPNGTRCPWEKPNAERHPSLGGKVKVIGGGQTSRDLVVAPGDKASVVRALREKHGRQVYVIGGTELDVPMLKAAGKNAFIRPPSVGEMHKSVRELLQEHGGQATFLGPRQKACYEDWQGRGSDIFEVMGLGKEGRTGSFEEPFEERGTELEYMLARAKDSLNDPGC